MSGSSATLARGAWGDAQFAPARKDLRLELLTPALEAVDLVLPDRSLDARDPATGRLRGTDLWHLACALYVAGDAREELTFLPRDASQRRLARQLGFATP